MIEFILSDTERDLLQRLVERATADPDLRLAVCRYPVETKALHRLRERFFASSSMPRVLKGVEL